MSKKPMTGTRANTAEEPVEAYALDPPTLSADIEEHQAEAILCNAEFVAEPPSGLS
jgi:hypothetical protein